MGARTIRGIIERSHQVRWIGWITRRWLEICDRGRCANLVQPIVVSQTDKSELSKRETDMKAARFSFCVVPLLCIVCGCFDSGPRADTLDKALEGSLPDQDGDGLFDIAPPDGVPFDLEETLGANIRSTITFAEAKALAGTDVPDFVEAWVAAEIKLLVTYEDGSTQTLTGMVPIAPFELKAEIACPIAVEARATVFADVPFAGRETIATFGPVVVDQSQFAPEETCGVTLDVEISLNDETGLPETVVNTR